MLIDKSGSAILDEVDSSSAVPGGGSVSALVGAFGVSLARMYGHLSIAKKRFLALDEKIQADFKENFETLEALKEDLIEACDNDSEAYDEVMKAYRLPKENDEEKILRMEAIKKATDIAIASPLKIMELAIEAMRIMVKMIDHGNKNAISDLGCAILFMDGAINGASLNVLINLGSIEEEKKFLLEAKVNELINESTDIKNKAISKIKDML